LSTAAAKKVNQKKKKKKKKKNKKKTFKDIDILQTRVDSMTSSNTSRKYAAQLLVLLALDFANNAIRISVHEHKPRIADAKKNVSVSLDIQGHVSVTNLKVNDRRFRRDIESFEQRVGRKRFSVL
jgi:hypothetical protein